MTLREELTRAAGEGQRAGAHAGRTGWRGVAPCPYPADSLHRHVWLRWYVWSRRRNVRGLDSPRREAGG